MIGHYCFFLNMKQQHPMVVMIYYRCIIWNKSRNDAIDRLNNSALNDKGSLKSIAHGI